jgi:hypothetical protein
MCFISRRGRRKDWPSVSNNTILHGSYGLVMEKVLSMKPYIVYWLYVVLPAFLSQLHWIKHMSATTSSSTSQLRAPPPREVREVMPYVTQKKSNSKLNEQKENEMSRKALASSCERDYTSYSHVLCSTEYYGLDIRLLGLNGHFVIIAIEKRTVGSDELLDCNS